MAKASKNYWARADADDIKPPSLCYPGTVSIFFDACFTTRLTTIFYHYDVIYWTLAMIITILILFALVFVLMDASLPREEKTNLQRQFGTRDLMVFDNKIPAKSVARFFMWLFLLIATVLVLIVAKGYG